MSNQPISLNDDQLDQVTGGVGAKNAREDEHAELQAAALAMIEKQFPGGISGESVKMLEKFMVEMAGSQRHDALNDRLAARDAATKELMSAAEHMKDQAGTMMQGAITQMITSVIGAGVGIAGSSHAIKGFDHADMKDAFDKNDLASEKMTHKAGMMQDQSFSQQKHAVDLEKMQGMSQAFSGMGQTSTMGHTSQFESKQNEASGHVDAAEAQYQQQVTDSRQEVMQQTTEMMQKVIDFIKELKDAETAQMRAITRV
ncbi:hypothetical protein DevBK_11800 [Devosia sp. BK]|uniref:hypothetical protein n=1 Tax=unclassified Devosia TaxID=196773 RepID=UPI0007159FDD|nr:MULTISPECIES: hypothetical protein [unclassified Devosia]KQT50252.1 hypothetical protein ASG47_19890 [Devosia sp. Leaf420]MDV3252017.1 hypothetical protein [Devosia sp. BK]